MFLPNPPSQKPPPGEGTLPPGEGKTDVRFSSIAGAVQGVLRLAARDAIHGKARRTLERLHRREGAAAKHAVCLAAGG